MMEERRKTKKGGGEENTLHERRSGGQQLEGEAEEKNMNEVLKENNIKERQRKTT